QIMASSPHRFALLNPVRPLLITTPLCPILLILHSLETESMAHSKSTQNPTCAAAPRTLL
uniref:Uncharacterized protein n=1 Tax=Aegilops tauschii subsp. strangulata TaxID=200361 RepID=A0A453NNG5_AEGTS